MKAITLYDPWGSLMAIGAKVNETRGCRTSHRGDICIHVAKTDHGCSDEVMQAAVKAFLSRNLLPSPNYGCIVAVVDLYDVRPFDDFGFEDTNDPTLIHVTDEEAMFGNYSPGRFIYRTRNLRRLAKPVPCRGFQSIGWTVPADVAALVRAQLPLQCSFGAATDDRCTATPTHASTFNGERTEMLWCGEHHAALLAGLQTPGHSFVKL